MIEIQALPVLLWLGVALILLLNVKRRKGDDGR